MQGVLGWDYDIDSKYYLNFQLFGDVQEGSEASGSRTWHGATYEISGKWFRDALKTGVRGKLYTSGEGTLTEVFLEYELDDHWKASTGVMFWTGGEDTILGEYTDNEFRLPDPALRLLTYPDPRRGDAPFFGTSPKPSETDDAYEYPLHLPPAAFFHQGQCSCPDVTLFVIDDDSHAAGPFRLQQDGARMTFFYCLNGQARIDAQAADGVAFSEEIGKGNSLLFCLNGGFSISRAGKRIQAVGLQLRPECLRLFACQLGFVHDGLRKSSSRTLKGDIPLHLRILLEQILNCRDDGLLRDVFLAHKKYELLYQQIELLDRENSHKCVSPAECRAAHRAYAILLQDIGKPPSLPELAAAVGSTAHG